MRYLRLALLPLVFAACTEREAAAPDIEVTPNLGATVTNEIVYVKPARVTWMDTQPRDDWDVYLIGYDPADAGWYHDGDWDVGGIPAREHAVVSMEGFPDEFDQRDQYVLTTLGRAPLYLYTRASIPFGGTNDEFCDWATNDWIAMGHWTATLAVDNDVSGVDGTPGVNSFGGTEAGVLWGDDGSMYKYEWKYRAIWAPERDVFRVVRNTDRVVRIK